MKLKKWKRVYCMMLLTLLIVTAGSVNPVEAASYNGVEYSVDWHTWKQGASAWGSRKLGDLCTMSNSGCLITSIAILMAKSGAEDPNSFNPGVLRDRYESKGFVSHNSSSVAADGNLSYAAYSKSNSPNFYSVGSSNYHPTPYNQIYDDLNTHLSRGEYAVVNVNYGGHFVAVDYCSNGTVYIVDPAGSAKTTLKQYDGGIENATFFATVKQTSQPDPRLRNDSSSPVATDTLNSHKYELFDYSMSWKEARDFCKNRGGHLVTITSSAENNLVTKLIQRGKKGHYFIGCTDEGSIGTWRWITGEAFNYENWDKAGEPTNNANEIVGTIVSIDNPPNKQTGEWVDVENKNTSTSYYSYANTGFVCEYEPTNKTVSIASAQITGLGNKVWTGKKLVPSLGVTVAGTKLVKGTHYTVSCTNNVNVGTAKITIKGKGKYTGSLTKSFKIIPRTTSVTVSKGKKRFIARWKLRIPQTSGYELQYSTNRSFKSFFKYVTISNNLTLSKNVTNLKSKTTYYVRIRTYKLVGSKKYYSNWSKTVTVKPT